MTPRFTYLNASTAIVGISCVIGVGTSLDHRSPTVISWRSKVSMLSKLFSSALGAKLSIETAAGFGLLRGKDFSGCGFYGPTITSAFPCRSVAAMSTERQYKPSTKMLSYKGFDRFSHSHIMKCIGIIVNAFIMKRAGII
jgi:hypothetical protein